MAFSADSSNDHLEASKRWLLKAVSFDNENKSVPALSCYKQGLENLMEFLKSVPETETAKREAIRGRIIEYLTRAEVIKKRLLASGQISSQVEPRHTQYRIAEGETGYGYHRLFGDCLKDASVVWVRVEDPYIRKVYQIHFFLQFCELCVVQCPNSLQEIQLLTGQDESEPARQLEFLNSVGASLAERGVRLILTFRDSLHDREVFFSNGWRVKIGRGLSLYQKTTHSPAGLGTHELSLRRCLETTVDVFHESILH